MRRQLDGRRRSRDGQDINKSARSEKFKCVRRQTIWSKQLARFAFNLTLCLVSILSLDLNRADALKVSISVPELVKLNDSFWLNCSHYQRAPLRLAPDISDAIAHQLEVGSLEEIYAIKWYKDDEEFYRFLPNAEPKVSIYETNGVQLDQTRSHEGNVLVSKADVNTEGNYRCEIVSEAPSFETVRKSKKLKVYALPIRGPRIEILDSNGRAKSPKAQEISYAVGDKIELRCNSAPSKPAARLRWYLNDHELLIPSNSSGANNPESRQRRNSLAGSNQALGYEVRVTPIEYRPYYKGIYSSHSTLSLVLQRDDLINNKISFKCLASMRQEVLLKSKQLIVLTPPLQTMPVQPPSGANLRFRRSRLDGVQANILGLGDSEAHVHHRQRPQHHRHSVSRLQPSQQLQQQAVQAQPSKASLSLLSSELINNLHETDSRNQLMYIYEDADSTLGSSILDSPESLESYVRNSSQFSGSTIVGENNNHNYNNALDFNRADNLEYIQLLRERSARQRSFPPASNSIAQSLPSSSSSSPGGSHNVKRFHGANSLVKSPLYLDENDSLRPVISWPPLESGKLLLLSPGQTLVAIPTQISPLAAATTRRSSSAPAAANEHRFILPPSAGTNNQPVKLWSLLGKELEQRDDETLSKQIILERLIQNLNCSSTDGSIDTKLGWLINDNPVAAQDVRFYPTRVSPDHRQSWITIGLQSAPPTDARRPMSSALIGPPIENRFQAPQPPSTSASNSLSPLRLVLDQYFRGKSVESNNQIKFTCQATHLLLLYSSSEMITFDFNPSPSSQVDGDTNDILNSPSSNVIQAASASRSNSAALGRSSNMFISLGSQSTFMIISLTMSTLFIHLAHLRRAINV